jgi:alpha-galactosidase/6-phospho-beta-glucosidase family protein
MSRGAIQQYRMVGYLPVGDTPRAGGWWYHTDFDTKRRWFGPLGGFDSEVGWAEYIRTLEEGRATMYAVAADPSARVTDAFPPAKSREQIVPIMDALTNDVAGDCQVNIPNNGLIAGLPDDIVVEVPAHLSRRGVEGVPIGRMPESVMVQVLLPRLVQAERVVSFARRPTAEAMLDLILYRHTAWSNRYAPPVASFEEAVRVRDEALRDDPALRELIQPLAR